jgi:GxxExxY protein
MWSTTAMTEQSAKTREDVELGAPDAGGEVRLHRPVPEAAERIAHDVIGAAIAVHRAIGPGFLEPIYRRALKVELELRGIGADEEQAARIRYRGESVGSHRADLIVGNVVVVEVKAVRQFEAIHLAQLASYLKAFDLRLGLLINFNVTLLRDGVRRVVR